MYWSPNFESGPSHTARTAPKRPKKAPARPAETPRTPLAPPTQPEAPPTPQEQSAPQEIVVRLVVSFEQLQINE